MTALPEPLEIGSADARVASPVPSDYSPPASFAPLSTARLGRGEDGGTGWKRSVARAVSWRRVCFLPVLALSEGRGGQWEK